MAQQTINLGTAPTGAGGDTPRTAFQKAIDNFAELYNAFYAAKGANSDITSLSGLTTALSVGQGGTGVKTMAALLTALQAVGGFGKSNILGTVSQASGVPTGAIIETGTNANGTYTKFADGTLVCRKALIYSTTYTPSAAGNLFKSPVVSGGSMPAAFTTLDSVQCSGTDSAGGGWPAMDIYPSGTAWGSYSCMTTSGGSRAAFTVYLEAVGRWF